MYCFTCIRCGEQIVTQQVEGICPTSGCNSEYALPNPWGDEYYVMEHNATEPKEDTMKGKKGRETQETIDIERDTIDLNRFRIVHPYIIEGTDGNGMEPLRFKTYECALATAVYLKISPRFIARGGKPIVFEAHR